MTFLKSYYTMTSTTKIQEICLPIKNYKDLYNVSNLGYVMSSSCILRTAISSGYKIISLSKNNVVKSVRIHRLVALAFIPNPENKPQVNHKDGNKLNNIVSNLEWATAKENSIHSWENGLQTVVNNKKILQINKHDGRIIKEFNSLHDAGRSIIKKGAYKNISSCALGKLKTAYGYKWEYIKGL